ncbi:hypothetical protein FGIG_00922 [Fasciola gigantica]|uniref:Uncharacterized protein n=1 Tax=Fasciola gigantica TaxID=46835 RepID=A0A504Z4K1_FASGI|nr:hypothetical protein FGIG_00922 [Fasciola gigantica]
MSSTLAIQLSIWMLMCNLSIRECKANEPAPVTEPLQSLQKADTIFDTPNSASSVQQAKEDRTRASDSNDDPSTWSLSLVITEPVYQFVPFSLTARILDKNDKELHTNDWSPIFKTTKCIHRVKEDAVMTPDKYVATEPGECNLECELTLSHEPSISWNFDPVKDIAICNNRDHDLSCIRIPNDKI